MAKEISNFTIEKAFEEIEDEDIKTILWGFFPQTTWINL